ncbi:MAG: response regulator transcription factor [Candidatus Symbiothrix sp.]|jgi:DNA-binding NarL/FixJ family response regulator|nr:response regulator transcription factor [Candidatus Symbiothrix sp.]
MTTFILADNQYITREGVSTLLTRTLLADAIIEVSSRVELIKQLELYPEAVVVLDYTLFDLTDTQLMNMKQKYAASFWLLFSDELSQQFLRQVLLAEQQFGVVMKTDTKATITKALQQAAKGTIYLCDFAAQVLQEDVPSQGLHGLLTASEQMVLREIAFGKTTKEIAFDHNVSFHTINTHRKNIFHKLEVNNLHEAIKYALRAGIIDLAEYCI